MNHLKVFLSLMVFAAGLAVFADHANLAVVPPKGARAEAPAQQSGSNNASLDPLSEIRENLSKLCDKELQEKRKANKAKTTETLEKANPPQWTDQKGYLDYFDKIEASIDWPTKQQDFQKAKERTIAAIEKRYPGPENQSMRDGMIAKVNKTEIYTQGEFTKRAYTSPGSLGVASSTLTEMQGLLGASGFGGMGAVNIPAGDKNIIVIPPSVLAGMTKDGLKDGKMSIDPQATDYLLSHELGHSYDNASFANIHEAHRNNVLTHASESGMSAEKLASETVQREVVAETAYAETLAAMVRKMRDQGIHDPEKIKEALKTAINQSEHCADPEMSDDYHPKSGFVLNRVVGNYKPLSNLLISAP
jgi:hypothetical protein